MRKGGKKAGDITLVEDDVTKIHKKKGNGILRRQVWSDSHGQVSRYSLAYINYNIFQGDNGRVLGYDNAHNYHHKHFMGKIEAIEFVNFETIEEQFIKEFEVIHEQAKK